MGADPTLTFVNEEIESALAKAREVAAEKRIVPDDIYQIRAVVSRWIADSDVNVIITTGGTGVTGQVTSGVGVRGRGTQAGSRGGVFQGQAAAVNLTASTRTTHPTSGRRGDLFVDASGRLWFCKGGTTWKQLG